MDGGRAIGRPITRCNGEVGAIRQPIHIGSGQGAGDRRGIFSARPADITTDNSRIIHGRHRQADRLRYRAAKIITDRDFETVTAVIISLRGVRPRS